MYHYLCRRRCWVLSFKWMKVLHHDPGSNDPNWVRYDVTDWPGHSCGQEVLWVFVISLIIKDLFCIFVDRKEKSMKSWYGDYVCSITWIFKWNTFIKAFYAFLLINCGHCMPESSIFLRFMTWRILQCNFLNVTMIFNLVRVISSGLQILTDTNPAIRPATKC